MPLTCDIGRPERDAVLDAFRQGRLRALVSSRVLNEGLDVPDADVAVIVGGALGEREHVQRVGRLLRPSPGKRALVYELVTRQTIEVSQAWRRRQGLSFDAPRSYRLVGGVVVPRLPRAKRTTPGCGRSSTSVNASSVDPSGSSTPACGTPSRSKGHPARSSSRSGFWPSSDAQRATLPVYRRATPAGVVFEEAARAAGIARAPSLARGELPRRDPRGPRGLALRRLARRARARRPAGLAVSRRTRASGQPRPDPAALVPGHGRDPRGRGQRPGPRPAREAAWAPLHGVSASPRRGTPSSSSLAPLRSFVIPLLYGRALGSLGAPPARGASGSACARACLLEDRLADLQLATGDPIFPAAEPRRFDSQLEERFAQDFRRVAPDWDVLREPEPIPAGTRLVFPDFALQHRVERVARWLAGACGVLDAGISSPEARTVPRGARGEPDPLHRRGSRMCRGRAPGGCRDPQIPPTGRCSGGPARCHMTVFHPQGDCHVVATSA